jgi:hypothetical protein
MTPIYPSKEQQATRTTCVFSVAVADACRSESVTMHDVLFGEWMIFSLPFVAVLCVSSPS